MVDRAHAVMSCECVFVCVCELGEYVCAIDDNTGNSFEHANHLITQVLSESVALGNRA